MTKTVLKRDGKRVEYDIEKIESAIHKAFVATGLNDLTIIKKVAEKVDEELNEAKELEFSVETIQKKVEKAIAHFGYTDVAKAYKNYRKERERARKKNDKMFLKVRDITEVADRENANVGNGPSAKLLQIAETASKEYADANLYSKETQYMLDEGRFYIHDSSWGPTGSTTCTFIPFDKLLKKGFNSGHGFIRPPKRIGSAAALVCIIFQANQNDQHGGQASGYFDRELAPFVKLEYERQLKDVRMILEELGVNAKDEAAIEEMAWKRTVKETMQAMESLIHNLNTMHSRAGAQVPFTSVNLGTDTSKEGRLITECLLKAYNRGLGKGEQPLFPNIIFKVKNGVNYEVGTPNHDLLELAMKVTADRLYPIYNFQDCTLNKDFPEDVPSMGCRTRIAWNRFVSDEEQSCIGRGNLSFTTVDMPGHALYVKYGEGKDRDLDKDYFETMKKKYNIHLLDEYNTELVKKFFVEIDKTIDAAIRQLLDRFKYQSKFTKSDFPFLMSGVWMDSEKLAKDESVREMIKHGTLSVGFIGLAETLVCLYGKHHAEDEVAQQLGLEIIKYMHEKVCVEAPELFNMNFSLLGTPAEGLTGKLLEQDLAKYGTIPGVTDKEWYTNSMHCPVEFNESLFHKIDVEGEYIKYLTAGNITYMEFNESPKDNLEAVWKTIQYLHDHDIALGAINFPCDRCRDCEEHGTINEDTCPVCGSTNISRVRRITGYLAEIDNFNSAKKAEALHRVKHVKTTDF